MTKVLSFASMNGIRKKEYFDVKLKGRLIYDSRPVHNGKVHEPVVVGYREESPNNTMALALEKAYKKTYGEAKAV